ncbi:hypothetical protein ABZ319_33195 [Nocardia sp. NPDC005978]|uniref:TPR repeat region-containing protein n=1 Tax=Nocardia sp. NPDC005978 TaxID=3156725 RepID=UPI0033A7BDC5
MSVPTPEQIPLWSSGLAHLESNAAAATVIANGIRTAVDDMDRTVDGMNWSGEGRRGADTRTDSEVRQMRVLATAFDDLATACRDGHAAMAPVVAELKAANDLLPGDGYKIHADWRVTDEYNFAAANSVAGSDQALKDTLAQLQADRSATAANETVRLQGLATGLGVSDTDCATRMGRAIDDIGQLAPIAAGLNPTIAQQDIAAIQDGKATPDVLARLQAASALSQEQFDDLINGKKIDIPQQQYDYLYTVLRSLDGKSVEEISAVGAQLPADQARIVRSELADAMQLMSNPQIAALPPADAQISGESDTGGIAVLPTQVQSLLRENPVRRGYYTSSEVLDVPRANDFLTLTDMLATGDQRLAQGTDIDRGLLKQGAEIAAEPFPHIWVDTNAGGMYGSQLADRLLTAGGGDRLAVHDFLTDDGKGRMQVTVTPGGTYDAKSHLAAVLDYRWFGDDTGINKIFDTIEQHSLSSDREVKSHAGESAHAIAEYLGKNGTELLRQGSEFRAGIVADPDTMKNLGDMLSTYLPDMVGVNADYRLTSGFQPLSAAQVTSIFTIMDSNSASALQFNAQAFDVVAELNRQYGLRGADDTELATWSGQIDKAAQDGARIELQSRVGDQADTKATKIAIFDSLREVAAYEVKKVPLVGGLLELNVKSASPFVKLETLGTVPELDSNAPVEKYGSPPARYFNILEGMSNAPDRPDLRTDPDLGRYFDPSTGALRSFDEIRNLDGNAPQTNLPQLESALRKYLNRQSVSGAGLPLTEYDSGWASGHGHEAGIAPR